jgi:hypothetical protein
MEQKYNLPKKYLSYSAYYLWKTNPNEFRRRYYLNEPSIETTETIFGKKVDEHIDGGEKIKGIIDYEKKQFKITINLDDGLTLLGYLDAFDPDNLAILERKTGHLSKDGKAPWDNVKVKKHAQLVFYSLLVNEKFGRYNPFVTLQWMETEFVKKTMEFDGHELETQSKELRLTGKVLTFKRRILKREIAKLKEDIIKVALEITDDYKIWQESR